MFNFLYKLWCSSDTFQLNTKLQENYFKARVLDYILVLKKTYRTA